MAPDLRVFVVSADRELAAYVADSPGLKLVGATTDRTLARAALTALMADVYVLDWRVLDIPQDLSAVDPATFAAAVIVAKDTPPIPGWERSGGHRRLFPEPYDPLEIVAWAQWLSQTQHEYRRQQPAQNPPAADAAPESDMPTRRLQGGDPDAPGRLTRLRELRAGGWPVGTRSAASADSRATSRVLAVCSPKGGVGKTTIAANLAVALAVLGQDVLLADLDLSSSDIGVHFDLDGGPTLLDLLPKLEALDRPRLDRELPRHISGVRVLRGPARPDLAQYVTTEDVIRLLDWSRKHFSWVVVDTAPDAAQDVLYQVIERADVTLVVSSLDAASLHRTRMFLSLLRQLSLPVNGDLRLVVNRATAGSPVSVGGVQGYLGLAPAAVLPEDVRSCENAVFDGQPLVWRGKPAALVDPIRRMAADLCGHAAPETQRARWALWSSLQRRLRG
ncbi:MAG: AAA family ATPase [Clostridia bacterium]|nr:AAA family ATPase [Clostridia bacterium]